MPPITPLEIVLTLLILLVAAYFLRRQWRQVNQAKAGLRAFEERKGLR